MPAITDRLTSRRPRRAPRARRGAALFMVLLFTTALAALAMSAIFLGGHATVVARVQERDSELKYVADAGLQLAKGWISTDPGALPDTGYREVALPGGTITDAAGTAIPNTSMQLWVGPTGAPTTSGTSFADIIAKATDNHGGTVIRRLEVTRESFAKFAYFTDRESATGTTIYFGPGDVLYGPVWSNDTMSILSGSPAVRFQDSVWTAAPSIAGQSNATWAVTPLTSQRRITLPSTGVVGRLRAIATPGQLAFTAPTSGNPGTTRMRIEFVGVDLNGDGDVTDRDEGFIRVYQGNASAGAGWVRGDFPGSQLSNLDSYLNCGDFHTAPNGTRQFFPASVHNDSWFRGYIGTFRPESAVVVDSEVARGPKYVMNRAGARCYPGGAPQLVAASRAGATSIGGTDTTFTATDQYGAWLQYTGAIDPRLAARADRNYLFPLSRVINGGSRGVIDVQGTVGVSGVLTGRATLHSTTSIVILDDLTYATPPGGANCADILGMVADRDIVVADNAINTPQDIDPTSATVYKSLDDTQDLWLNGVAMTLNTSFTVENFNSGPSSGFNCGTAVRGRGCLYLVGGLIQSARGAVAQSCGAGCVTGYGKSYSYDRCAATNPPPYFPTTGRFLDNYYYEIDPSHFRVDSVFDALTPG